MGLQPRTRNLVAPGQVLYNIECRTCSLGALANSLSAAEGFAKEHIRYRPEHTVWISGRGLPRMVIDNAMVLLDDNAHVNASADGLTVALVAEEVVE